MSVKPVLKYPGSKRTFVREYGDAMREHVLKCGGRYIEPFLGGASMAFHLGLPEMVLGEVDKDLMDMYIAIRDDVEEVIEIIDSLRESVDEESYYAMRSIEPEDWIEGAARVLYLNKLCYNGLYRKNQKGQFNMAYNGEKRDLISAEHLRVASKVLQGAQLFWGDFSNTTCIAQEGDVIYADPPYDGTFTGYSGKGFDETKQAELAMELECAAGQGVEFFCHNSDTSLIRKLYSEFTFIPMPEKRMINRDGKGRGKVPCVLITNAEL